MRIALRSGRAAPRARAVAASQDRVAIVYAIAMGVLVAIAGMLVRGAALRGYATLPAGFDGVYSFRARYLLEHGRLLTEALPTYSYWSLGVNTELGFYLMEAILAAVMQLQAWTGLGPRLIHQLLLSGCLIGLASFLLLRGRPQATAVAQAPLVAALITLGTPVAIVYLGGWNSAYGWVLLLAVTVVATSGLDTVWCRLLTLLIAVSGPPLYHTFGLLLNVYVLLLWLCLALVGQRGRVVSPLVALVCYLAYQLYVSVQFFRELTMGLRDVLTLAFLGRDTQKLAVAVAGADEAYLRYVHLALWSLLCLPIAMVAWRYVGALRARWGGKGEAGQADLAYLAAATALGAAVALVAILFGLKFSVEFMINRGAEYLLVPAVLAVIAELRLSRGGRRLYLLPLGAVVLALSLFSFWVQAPTVRASNYYSLAEAEGYAWLRERLAPEDVVFSDFRLAGAFIADGHFRVVGVTGNRTERTFELLDAIFYRSTPASVGAAIDTVRTDGEGEPPRYLFLSRQMERSYPGLDGFGTHFQPAPPAFFAAIAASPEWRLVYENQHSLIYERVPGRQREASIAFRKSSASSDE